MANNLLFTTRELLGNEKWGVPICSQAHKKETPHDRVCSQAHKKETPHNGVCSQAHKQETPHDTIFFCGESLFVRKLTNRRLPTTQQHLSPRYKNYWEMKSGESLFVRRLTKRRLPTTRIIYFSRNKNYWEMKSGESLFVRWLTKRRLPTTRGQSAEDFRLRKKNYYCG